ncbi:MAG: hypothetical protein ACOX1E_07700 [Erysipelotrichaceae bacterium]
MFTVFFLIFILSRNANPLYLFDNHNIDRIVIDDIDYSKNSIIITDEGDINKLVSCFNNYNFSRNKTESIDSILPYKISFYANNPLLKWILSKKQLSIQ